MSHEIFRRIVSGELLFLRYAWPLVVAKYCGQDVVYCDGARKLDRLLKVVSFSTVEQHIARQRIPTVFPGAFSGFRVQFPDLNLNDGWSVGHVRAYWRSPQSHGQSPTTVSDAKSVQVFTTIGYYDVEVCGFVQRLVLVADKNGRQQALVDRYDLQPKKGELVFSRLFTVCEVASPDDIVAQRVVAGVLCRFDIYHGWQPDCESDVR